MRVRSVGLVLAPARGPAMPWWWAPRSGKRPRRVDVSCESLGEAGAPMDTEHASQLVGVEPVVRDVIKRRVPSSVVDDLVQATLEWLGRHVEGMPGDELRAYAIHCWEERRGLLTTGPMTATGGCRAAVADLNQPEAPEALVIATEEAATMRRTLASMDEADRELLEAHHVHETSVAVLARRTGRSEMAVRPEPRPRSGKAARRLRPGSSAGPATDESVPGGSRRVRPPATAERRSASMSTTTSPIARCAPRWSNRRQASTGPRSCSCPPCSGGGRVSRGRSADGSSPGSSPPQSSSAPSPWSRHGNRRTKSAVPTTTPSTTVTTAPSTTAPGTATTAPSTTAPGAATAAPATVPGRIRNTVGTAPVVVGWPCRRSGRCPPTGHPWTGCRPMRASGSLPTTVDASGL